MGSALRFSGSNVLTHLGKSDVSSHPFVLEDLSTKLGDPRDKKNGVYQGALRRRGRLMRPDLF